MENDNPSTAPLAVLMTPRLRLRAFSRDDAADVYAYAANPAVARWTTWDPHATIDDSRRFVDEVCGRYAQGNYFSWAIEDRNSGRVVGSCGFDGSWNRLHRRAELGYALAEAHWGRGLMREAVEAVLAYGFRTLDLNRIEALCVVENRASARVMEKAGMRWEGTLREWLWLKGTPRSCHLYSILRSEFAGPPA